MDVTFEYANEVLIKLSIIVINVILVLYKI